MDESSLFQTTLGRSSFNYTTNDINAGVILHVPVDISIFSSHITCLTSGQWERLYRIWKLVCRGTVDSDCELDDKLKNEFTKNMEKEVKWRHKREIPKGKGNRNIGSARARMREGYQFNYWIFIVSLSMKSIMLLQCVKETSGALKGGVWIWRGALNKKPLRCPLNPNEP